MGLSKYKLGELITQRREKYDGKETLCSWGVSRDGFIRPKQEDADTSIYNVFYRNDFVFNPARMELNSIALNSFYDKAICSSLYEIFYVTREDIVLPEYLNMFIKRDEFARKCWYEAIGSARNYFRVGDLSQFEIALPSIEQQRKYVDVYLALQNNLAAYQSKVEELKMVCDGLLSNLDNKHCRHEKIGNYIKRNQRRNKEKHYKKSDVRGFNNDGQFIYPMRLFSGDISSFKIIQKNDFVYNSRINNTIKKLSVALNNGEELIVSPAYESFYVSEEKFLYPYYLYMLLQREDFAKKVLFNSFGSSTVVFGFDELGKIEIPIPDISVQREIVNIHKCYIERQRIAEALKEQMKNICPVLIRGSLTEE